MLTVCGVFVCLCIIGVCICLSVCLSVAGVDMDNTTWTYLKNKYKVENITSTIAPTNSLPLTLAMYLAINAHVCGVAGSDDLVVVEEEFDAGVLAVSDAEQLQVVVRVLQCVLVPLPVEVLVVYIPLLQSVNTGQQPLSLIHI